MTRPDINGCHSVGAKMVTGSAAQILAALRTAGPWRMWTRGLAAIASGLRFHAAKLLDASRFVSNVAPS